MKKKSVSAVIPNYNGVQYLQKLLDSIYAQTLPFDEIIVVDDASTDQSIRFMEDNYPSITILKNDTNQGFIRSVNRGIQYSSSRYVCLLNNDLYLAVDWLEKAMEPFCGDTAVGAVATNILIAGTASLIDAQGDDYFITGAAVKRNNLQQYLPDNPQAVRVFSACGAAVLYDSDVLKKVGLYDAYLSAYYDDVDIAFRINLYGCKIIYTPHAVSYHRVSASYGKKPKTMIFNSYRNAEIVFWSNMPTPLLWKYALLRVVFVMMESFFKLLKLDILIYMRAKIAFFRAIPYVIRKRINTQRLRRCSTSHIQDCLRKDWINYFIVRKFR